MKNVWGLGAAVMSLLLVVVFWTVYVTGRLATTGRLAPSETVEGIEVPVIGTVGDFPEPERRIVVNVTADARTTVERIAVADFDGLVAALRQRDGGDGDSTSRSVVLRADRRVAWGVAQGVFAACAEAGIDRVFFAVQHEQDKSDGAIFACRPKQLGPPRDDDTGRVVRRIMVWDIAGDGTPKGVYEDLVALGEPRTDRLVVFLDIDSRVSFGFATRTLDAALRAGAADVRCMTGDPARSLPNSQAVIEDAYEVKAWTEQSDSDASHVREIAPSDLLHGMPAVGRVRDRYAGLPEPRER